MDYVVGSIAALISGNVTPNRPKLTKRALTPIKHMPSPNVTPKSEFVEDRSVFLSPSVQKKKAIVKKSPKRIFQNPDLDVTNGDEGNTSTSSPKADKVKKHLKGELEAAVSPKKSKASNTFEKNQSMSVESPWPKKNKSKIDLDNPTVSSNELTPKKKKKQRNSISDINQSVEKVVESNEGTPKKVKKNKNINKENIIDDTEIDSTNLDASVSHNSSKKKKNKNKLKTIESEVSDRPDDKLDTELNETETTSPKKKNKKRKKTKTNETTEDDVQSKPTKNKKIKVNPNAITHKDSDSEHESDDEIESETEGTNKEVLENAAEAEGQSSDEEETPSPKKKGKVETQETEKVKEVNTEEEIKRTLFVGNVPFSKKCKKEIKKIFSKYGQIESVRIRTVPVKDPSVTPKLAVIKQELHPERSTVNVYVKFADPQSVEDALAENNTILNNNHLRVTRSGTTGAEHDPRHSVFVGNIPFALEDEGLREKFKGCGHIESVRIVRDRKTNAGKGFGYVNFTSRDGVELALALTDEDLTIKNRIMRVKRCTQLAARAQRGRGGPNRPGFQVRNKPSQGDRQRNQPSGRPQRGFPQRGGFQARGGGRGGYGGRGGQGNRGRFPGNAGGRQNDGEQDGAYRRLANKRKSQEGGEGSPTKKARSDEPPREKKARKEFVGMTAEKKKKRKVDKGQKKKKALSEILTK